MQGKYVYVMKSANGLVKIGVSKNIEERIISIQYASGFKIEKYKNTNLLKNAYEVEKAVHEYFKEKS